MSDGSLPGIGYGLFIVVGIILFLFIRRFRSSLEETRRSLKRATSAHALAGFGYIEWHYDSDKVTVSQEVRTHLDLHPTRQLFSSDLISRVHPDDRDRVGEALAATITGEKYDIEHRFKIKKDESIWVHAAGEPLIDASGTITGLLGVFLDITDRIKLQEKQTRMTLQLQRARSHEIVASLTGRIAHDFNNVLQSVLGNLELGLESLTEDSNALDDFQAARTSAGKAAQLVADLKTLVMDESLNALPVDLEEVIRTAVAGLDKEQDDHVTTTLDLDPGCPPVLGDRDALETALGHLYENAVEAAVEGGSTVHISLRTIEVDSDINREYPEISSTRIALITVTDDGLGISESNRSRLFDPLFSTKPSGAGVGLGLPIVRSVVEGMGGVIRLHVRLSTTSFVVVLPIENLDHTRDIPDSEGQSL